VQPLQLAQAESNVEEKTEQKTTTTDNAGLPEEGKHVEHETNQSASDSTGVGGRRILFALIRCVSAESEYTPGIRSRH
jgi:hypothetical protein